jgi:hypothetical protein
MFKIEWKQGPEVVSLFLGIGLLISKECFGLTICNLFIGWEA